MASSLYSPDHRPDPAHWTRTNVGLASPLWWPFLMAAGAGAAWWTYTNWGRMAATSWTGDLQRLGDAVPGSETNGGPATAAAATLAQSLAVQGDESVEDDIEELVDDGSDAIDAAYAANLGPVLAPKKRAAAGKTNGRGSSTKAAAKKSTAAKTPAKKIAGKAPAKKAVAKKATRTNTAAKKTAAKSDGRKR